MRTRPPSGGRGPSPGDEDGGAARSHRSLVLGLLALVVGSAVMVTMVLAGSSEDPREPRLLLERATARTGVEEIIATIEPGDGARSPGAGERLRLRCDDAAGASVLDADGRLTDDGGTLLPHVHFAMTTTRPATIVTCVASGNGSVLRASLTRR